MKMLTTLRARADHLLERERINADTSKSALATPKERCIKWQTRYAKISFKSGHRFTQELS
jgi:hypothetical protein